MSKDRARAEISAAIRHGRLVRGSCVFAGRGKCRGRIEAHHPDYTRPVEVVWVCKWHHTQITFYGAALPEEARIVTPLPVGSVRPGPKPSTIRHTTRKKLLQEKVRRYWLSKS